MKQLAAMATASTLFLQDPTLNWKPQILYRSPQFPTHNSYHRIKIRKNSKNLSVKCFFAPTNGNSNDYSAPGQKNCFGETPIKQNPAEIVAKTIVNALKALQKPAAAAVLVGLLLMYDPNSALAASGGRVGGSSFSSRSSMSSSRSYSAPRMGAGSGLSYSVPFYAPSPFGGVYAGPAVGFGSSFFLIMIAFVAFVTVSGFLSEGSEGSVLTATERTSVLKLQVGLLGMARSLQKDLNRIAETADTSTSEGLHYVLTGLRVHSGTLHFQMNASSFPAISMPLPTQSPPQPRFTLTSILLLSEDFKKKGTQFTIFALASPARDVWRRRTLAPAQPIEIGPPQPHRRKQNTSFLDHSVDMDELLSSIGQTKDEHELFALMSVYKNRCLSIRFMVTLLSREPDWQRSLALLDWINEEALYTTSVFAYNVVLRNVLRAKQWQIAYGLFDEMRERALSPDKYTYSTLITHFGKEGLFDDALSWLQKMEQDRVPGDLVLYSNLIELSRKLCDYSKAISIFSRLKRLGIAPDLVAYNTMINVFGKAKLFREARSLISEMRQAGVTPDTVSYSTLLTMYVENQKFLEALSVFSEMREIKCVLDLTTCNIMIDVYGQLDMAEEADKLFWGMRKLGIEPNVVSYNTLLRVYGDAELFGEAIHLFRLMQRKDIDQNVVTYNTMISIYGKTLEHEKANNLIQEMQKRGIEPNAITYSTIISIWSKIGKLSQAAMLFQKLRSSGIEIDEVLYQTMIIAYERAGLVGHAKLLLHELKRPDNIPRETAINILAAAGRIEEATWVFRQAADGKEIKDIAVFERMIILFCKFRKYGNVIEVFERMRIVGYFPDSNVIALVLNAYGKLREFDEANRVYAEMQGEGCVFSDEVHFQMLSLHGARRDFEMVETLFGQLEDDPNINKKDLHLVVASIYERANRLNDASRIVNQMSDKGIPT